MSKADLDALATEQPIVVSSSDQHTTLVNSRALELAGITAETEGPTGGIIKRDAERHSSCSGLQSRAVRRCPCPRQRYAPRRSPHATGAGAQGHRPAARALKPVVCRFHRGLLAGFSMEPASVEYLMATVNEKRDGRDARLQAEAQAVRRSSARYIASVPCRCGHS